MFSSMTLHPPYLMNARIIVRPIEIVDTSFEASRGVFVCYLIAHWFEASRGRSNGAQNQKFHVEWKIKPKLCQYGYIYWYEIDVARWNTHLSTMLIGTFASNFYLRFDIATEAMDFERSMPKVDKNDRVFQFFSFFRLYIHVNVLEYVLHVIIHGGVDIYARIR